MSHGSRTLASTAAAAAALALLLASAAPRAAAQDRPADRLDEEITVFESQVAVDLSELSNRERQALEPAAVLLLEGGAPKRVTNVQPVAAGSWRVVIYVDAPLARARTVRAASLRLGSQAQALTDLGPVEVIVADPEPRRLLGPTREPRLVAQELAKLAESGVGTDELHISRMAFGKLADSLGPHDDARLEHLRRETALVRTRVDHLLRLAAEGCDGSLCALLLVSDGFFEEPAGFYLGESRLAEAAETQPNGVASRELAQTLAAYEWIALPLPLREDRLDAEVRAPAQSDFDRFLDHTGAIRTLPKAGDHEPDLSLEALEVSVTPILQPLQRLAVATAGEVVRIVDDVDPALLALRDVRRIFYLTNRQLDGELRAVAARLAKSGTPLETPGWIRSSTPSTVAGARVRALLAGAPMKGEAPIAVTVEGGAAGQRTLRIVADWGPATALVARSAIRITVAYPRSGELPWVGHQLVPPPSSLPESGRWEHALSAPLPGQAGRAAVLVEALVPRIWGAAVVQP